MGLICLIARYLMVSDNFFYLSCIILYLGDIIQSKLGFLNSTQGTVCSAIRYYDCQKILSCTVRDYFLRKNFSWFFVWVNLGDFQTIFGTQAGRTNVPVRYDLPVETGEVCWDGRKKESWRPSKISRHKKKNTFLDALWSGTLSLAFIGVYFHC